MTEGGHGRDPSASSAEDAERLAAMAAGDAQAFASWLADMEPALRASLQPFAAVADVEAVVQETFLRVWHGRGAIEPHPKGRTLERLAFTIGRRLAIDEARRAGRERDVAAWAEAELPALERDTSPDPHLRAWIEHCRSRLPKKPFAALQARIDAAGARRDRELAAELGMQENTFLQNLSRARKLLTACLEKVGIVLSEVMP
ncbi:MAG TPA: sigma factor [Myxococcales bacterium LLY-WYZ-16_1]|nr:sigma factor [Myxococcales bacterium LLY-WYZ-16_1]